MQIVADRGPHISISPLIEPPMGHGIAGEFRQWNDNSDANRYRPNRFGSTSFHGQNTTAPHYDLRP